jgi:hypothetical protein
MRLKVFHNLPDLPASLVEYVTSSKDPFFTLYQATKDFPKHAHHFVKMPFAPDLWTISAELRRLMDGDNMLILNGRMMHVEQLNVFKYLSNPD